MNPKTMQPLSAKPPDTEWGWCQDLSITSCKITNGTVPQVLSAAGLFIGALTMADDCFDGISDLIHDPVTTLISDIKDTVVIQI